MESDEVKRRQYIIERMEKYLMKYDLYDLLDLYIEVKTKSVKTQDDGIT